MFSSCVAKQPTSATIKKTAKETAAILLALFSFHRLLLAMVQIIIRLLCNFLPLLSIPTLISQHCELSQRVFS